MRDFGLGLRFTVQGFKMYTVGFTFEGLPFRVALKVEVLRFRF